MRSVVTSMGKRCVVAGCSNSHKDGVSLFKFPTNKSLRRLWIRQVQRTRAQWSGPSEYSCVCRAHFTDDCLEDISCVSKKIGMRMKQMLRPNAVPTIFPKALPDGSPPAKRRSTAYEKRERSRVSLKVQKRETHCMRNQGRKLLWLAMCFDGMLI